MSRLIVFGCSLAYGVGLPDCWPDTSSPSKFSWTQLTADAMGRTLINKSIPGASNKLIWHTIDNFDFDKDDVVIISWSYPDRHSILKTPKTFWNLHHNRIDVDPASLAYYKELHSRYDSTVMSKLYVDHAHRTLSEKNIPVYHLVVSSRHTYIMNKIEYVPIHMSKYEGSWPLALDDDHLGMEGQVAFAADLMNLIGVSHNLVKQPPGILYRLKRFLWKIEASESSNSKYKL
jgi:hypothetical protein